MTPLHSLLIEAESIDLWAEYNNSESARQQATHVYREWGDAYDTMLNSPG